MASSKITDLAQATAPAPTDQMYIVRPSLGPTGSLGIANNELFSIITRNIADKALRYEEAGTGAPLSQVNAGAVQLFPVVGSPEGYEFRQSINGFPYRTIVGAADSRVGLNVGVTTTAPTTLRDGDLWYDSTTNLLMAFINGVAVPLGPQAGAPRALPPIATIIGNVGSNPFRMHELIIPANTLRIDNKDYFRIVMAGEFAQNTNTKQLQLFWTLPGSGVLNNLFTTPTVKSVMDGAPTPSGAQPYGWRATIECLRTGAALATITTTIVGGVAIGDASAVDTHTGYWASIRNLHDVPSPSDFGAQNLSIAMYGAGTVDNDIVQNITTCDVYNF